MASIREMTACLQLSGLQPGGFKWVGNLSLLRDFWGYTRHPKKNIALPVSLSLVQQIDRLRGKHIHLNLIRVGDLFTDAQDQDINNATHKLREIYGTVNLGIGRIEHYFITVVQADGKEHIDNGGEAETLTNEWTVPNDALDVFLVRTSWGDGEVETVGLSKTHSPCDKDASCAMTGSVVSLGGLITGWVLAHEVSHYLGLSHINGLETDDVLEAGVESFPPEVRNNLMFPIPYEISNPTLNASQVQEMKKHCFVKSAC